MDGWMDWASAGNDWLDDHLISYLHVHVDAVSGQRCWSHFAFCRRHRGRGAGRGGERRGDGMGFISKQAGGVCEGRVP